MNVVLKWHNHNYFPYEKSLARLEVKALFGVDPIDTPDGLLVRCRKSEADLIRRLTYVKGGVVGGEVFVPEQARIEATAIRNGTAWNSLPGSMPELSRQVTRYSAHGWHEYRGKFNPQVVRAIGNLVGLKPCDTILDPFCGSGTTVLEAAHIGWNALGVDLNPLAVLTANAKVAAFTTSPSVLQREHLRLKTRLSKDRPCASWRQVLPEPEYLASWFPVPVLEQLATILHAIGEAKPKNLQKVFTTALSDICREVSYQDPADLRIRRRKNPAADYPALDMFLQTLAAKVDTVLRARKAANPHPDTCQEAARGDMRTTPLAVTTFISKVRKYTFDAAITSPPYATAMPYLDTQRLSLALLGLIPSDQLRRDEKMLIGNREIDRRERDRLNAQIRVNRASLPDPAIQFCQRLLSLADHEDHGFRRLNVPALLYKYLTDMADMFKCIRPLIRHGGYYALVVGSNATTMRGTKVEINTPSLLGCIAESRGWELAETVTLQTYQRYDIHQQNSIREEVLLLLRNR